MGVNTVNASRLTILLASIILVISMLSVAGAVSLTSVDVCDPTTTTQCASVNATGNLLVQFNNNPKVHLVDSTASNNVGVDTQGNLQTKTCDPTMGGQCGSVDSLGNQQAKICDPTTSGNCAKVNSVGDLFVKVDDNGSSIDVAQNGGGNTVPATGDTSFGFQQAAAATAKVLTGAAGKKFHITNFDIEASGSETVTIVEGTGTNCGTSQSTIWGPSVMIAGETIGRGGGIGDAMTEKTAADDVCITSTAAAAVTFNGEYAQF